MTTDEQLRKLLDLDAISHFGASTLAAFVDHELEEANRTLAPWAGDVRAAMKATHPDTPGGDHELFLKVIRARDVLRLRDGV